jgi:NAD(P)-dependent dehydrogenase (short-subunit alcohol dehydrogenase family)
MGLGQEVTDEWMKKIIQEVPMKRCGQPGEVASAVTFLAS